MALTIDVFPGNDTLPSFGQLAQWSTERLNWMLGQRGSPLATRVLVRCTDDAQLPADVPPERPFAWADGGYAWFVPEIAEGGVDVTLMDGVGELVEALLPEPGQPATPAEEVLGRAVALDRMWSFRTSMGQPPLVRFAQGVLAGTLAELTGGVVDSADGAMPELGPAFPGDLYSWWMDPGLVWEDQPFWTDVVSVLRAGQVDWS